MYKTEFEHENNTNYLVIMPDAGGEHNDYQQKMISRNKINGLLPVSIRNINNRQNYYYDITSRQQLSKLYEYNKITLDGVYNICTSISDIVKSINDYMLDLDRVIVEPEYMYINMKNKKISFAYCPDIKHVFSDDIKLLFEYIIEHFDHNSDRDELMKVYEIYHKVVHDEYNPQELSDLVSCSQPQEEILRDDHGSIDISIDSGMHNNSIIPDKKHEKSSEIKDQNIKKAVPYENIHTDKEEFNKKTFSYLKSARLAVIIIILYTAVALFYPKIAIIKMDMVISFTVIIVGLAVNVMLGKKIKNPDVFTNITTDNYSQPYLKSSNGDGGEYTSNKLFESENPITSGNMAAGLSEDQNRQIYEGNTILLSEYADDEEKKCGLRLVPENLCKAGEKTQDIKQEAIEICTFPCVIGSMKPYCDVIISNRIISRVHACIKKEDDKCYIEDMNSTNGTFVNDIRIKPDEKKKIANGDTIQIAALSYIVEIT